MDKLKYHRINNNFCITVKKNKKNTQFTDKKNNSVITFSRDVMSRQQSFIDCTSS